MPIDMIQQRNECEGRTQEFFAVVADFDSSNKKMYDIIVDFLEFLSERGYYVDVPHCKQVAYFTRCLLKKLKINGILKLSYSEIDTISVAALLHDIGKCILPKEMLLSDKMPATDNFEVIKLHAEYGARLIAGLPFLANTPYEKYAESLALSHHERSNGEGYPNGLTGEDYPVWIQAVSLTDVFSALISDRPYKTGYSCDTSVGIVISGEHGGFSSELITVFMDIAPKMYARVFPKRAKEEATKPSVAIKKKWTIRETLMLVTTIVVFATVILAGVLISEESKRLEQGFDGIAEATIEEFDTVSSHIVSQWLESERSTITASASYFASLDISVSTDIEKLTDHLSLLKTVTKATSVLYVFADKTITSAEYMIAGEIGVVSPRVLEDFEDEMSYYRSLLESNTEGVIPLYHSDAVGDDVLGIVYPVEKSDSKIGLISVLYTKKQLSEVFDVLLDKLSFVMRILENSSGEIIVNANMVDNDAFNTRDEMIKGLYLDQSYSKEELDNFFSLDCSTLSYNKNDSRRYVHISDMGISDWILLLSFSSEAIDGGSFIANNSIKELVASVTIVALAIIAIFITITCYIQQKLRRASEMHRNLYDQLHLSDQRTRVAFSNTRDVVFEYDLATKTAIHSRKARELYSLPDVTPNTPYSVAERGILDPATKRAYIDAYEKILNGAQKASCEILLKTATGEFVWNRLTLKTINSKSNAPVKAIGLLEDITAEKQAEQRMEQEKAYRRSLASYFQYRLEFDITANQLIKGKTLCAKYLNVNGSQPLSELSKKFFNIVHPDDVAELRRYFTEDNLEKRFVREKRHDDMEIRVMIEGLYRYLTIHITIYKLDNGHLYTLLLFNDVTKDRMELEKLEEMSKKDSQTGLYNKKSFNTIVKSILAKDRDNNNKHNVLVMIDIDNFKLINDTYGHAYGDTKIAKLVKVMNDNCRKTDVIGRVGGDEFMLLLPHVTSIDNVLPRLEKLIKLYAAKDNEEDAYSTISMGVAISPEHGRDYDTLFASADKALYMSKANGRNRLSVYVSGEDNN